MTATDANARLLLIDDDADLRQMMREYFARQGFDLATGPDGPRGLEAALDGTFDRVILGVMLRGSTGSGYSVRWETPIPVIALEVRVKLVDRPHRPGLE